MRIRCRLTALDQNCLRASRFFSFFSCLIRVSIDSLRARSRSTVERTAEIQLRLSRTAMHT